MTEKKPTGYPSVDKPWLKYYSEDAIKRQVEQNTIYDHLYENNKDYPDDIALMYFERKITYQTLFSKIEQCKNSLLSLGIKQGDIVTIQTLAIPQTVILLYALSRIGAVANLIYVSNNEQEVNAILKKTRSCAYFVIDSIFEKFTAVLEGVDTANVILLSIDTEMDFVTRIIYRITKKSSAITSRNGLYTWDAFMKLRYTGKKEDVTDSRLPAVMTYTGGTTGTSKAVVLTNRSINELVFQYEKADMGFERQKIFMDSLPPFIAFGLTVSLHLPLCMGIKTVLIADPLPQNQGKMFFKYKPNYYVASPAQIEAIFAHPKAKKADLSFFKLLATGGDALPATSERGIIDFLRSHNCQAPVFQGYGMSELAATVCTGKPSALRFGTVGIPLPNTNIKIMDMESGEELTYGCSGEVCIHAPSVMAGYYNDPEETAKIIHAHQDGLEWVHTGDIGVMDEDGFLKIIGRIKRIITIFHQGLYHKIYPKLLEEQFETLECVQSAVVVSSGTYVDDQKLVAFVVPSSFNVSIENELRAFAAEHFKEYEQPCEYRFLSQLPRTKISKVDYRALEREAASK